MNEEALPWIAFVKTNPTKSVALKATTRRTAIQAGAQKLRVRDNLVDACAVYDGEPVEKALQRVAAEASL